MCYTTWVFACEVDVLFGRPSKETPFSLFLQCFSPFIHLFPHFACLFGISLRNSWAILPHHHSPLPVATTPLPRLFVPSGSRSMRSQRRGRTSASLLIMPRLFKPWATLSLPCPLR